MLLKELRKKDKKELQALIVERKRDLMNLRFQQTNGQLKNTARVKEIRREIARMKTLINEPVASAKE